MRIGIVGAGPVGSIAAAHLARAGQEVYLADIWQEQLRALTEGGVHVEGALQADEQVHGGFPRASDLAAVEPEYLILSVKACMLRSMLPELAKVVTPRTVLVSMQNGLDTEEILSHAFNHNKILRFVVNFAGKVLEPGRAYASFFHPPNHIGCACRKEDCEDAQELAGMLNGGGLQTTSQRDVKRYVWEKTILNSSLSPVSAITGLTMREVMETPDTRSIVDSLLSESIKVAARVGYDFGPGFFEYCISYLERGGPHKPSMLMDVEARRETEIAFLNGRIAYYGDLVGVATPMNDMFTRLVRTLEHRYLPAKAGVA
ncbi:MAG: 2-dehydropantoate 2-reductase [Candidatus Sericytochromatia bacterium]|nr:2-dehydropantoate 2-reductase [Candidatus Tanganyikabacteria bacterium]